GLLPANGLPRPPRRPCSFPKEGTPVKRLCLRPIAARWPIGSALLLFALAGQALGSATISGTVKPAANGDLTDAVVAATSDKFAVVRATVHSAAGTNTATLPPATYTLAVMSRKPATPPLHN